MGKDWRMTRLEVSEGIWRRLKADAALQGVALPELLGSVVTGYVLRAEKRRARLIVERHEG